MQRRNVLGFGLTLAASAATRALADKPTPPAGILPPGPIGPLGPKGLPALDGLKELVAFLASLHACADVGEHCLVHCIEQLSTGSTAMTECARTLGAMIPACRALAAAALYGSSETKALSAVVGRLCRICEEACKKHAMHHTICADCAAACAKCATACEKMAA